MAVKRRSARQAKRPGKRPIGRGSRRPSVFDAALAAARGIAKADPLAAEVLASGILSVSRGSMPDDEADRAFAMGLVSRLARARTADALALLTAVHALLRSESREIAAAAAADLRRQGVAESEWAAVIDRPRLLEAWTATDEYGDQTMVGVGFRHGAWTPHALTFMVDRNFEGLVRQASVAPRPDLVLDVWADTASPDLVPHSATTQEVADLLAQGIQMYDLYLDPPVYDEVHRLMPLLRARLRILPEAQPMPEGPEVRPAARRRLARAFATSADAPAGVDAELLASYFIDYGCDYSGGDPLRWSPVRVELCLIDWFPRKVALEPDDIAGVPVALRGWVQFAARRKGISDVGLRETLAAIDAFEPNFMEAVADESAFGPAKSLFLAMTADGVDPHDEEAVQVWIGAHNARRLAETAQAAMSRGKSGHTRSPYGA